ncbi:uncharacterized protein RJT20DRAFT_126850 [Scheffersomyces xylosifermentans]|uniref:uncharacterized protein n=1 Tax=Scheffersomyces xylosifermentans TaxID=1304137 RepID=UPI00315C4FDD
MLAPGKALLIGGLCYGAGVVYMSTCYYRRSSLYKIYVNSDKEYENIKIMHHA